MLLLRKPSPSAIRDFLATQANLDLTYSAVGSSAAEPPPGYVVDRTRINLGNGERVFAAAKAALERWEQFRLGWVEAWPPNTPIQVGQVVGEDGPVKRLRHAAGTRRQRRGKVLG
jgi:uncharacterized protein (UPF0548 family)